ncbi:MAG: hypothetical protein AB8F34_01300 [Akkermansiaceae bacterium]
MHEYNKIAKLAVTIFFFKSASLLATEILETEPNNNYQQAQSVNINDTFTFTLEEKGDFDCIKIKSPGDGVIRVTQLKKSKTHGWVHPWWMINKKKYHRSGLWDTKAKKDELLVIGLCSHRHSWSYVASDEKITVKITFEPHLTSEPNDNYAQATPVKIGEPIKLQINPRHDHDFFTFTSPGNGSVVLQQIKKSPTHGYLHPWWMINAKQFIRNGEWSQRVSKDEKMVFGISSSRHSWQEVANTEIIELKLRFIPEISSHEPNDTPAQAKQIKIGEVVTLMMAPRLDRDYYRIIAPEDGVMRIEQLNRPKVIGKLHPWWMINDKKYTRSGEFSQAVTKGQNVIFGLQADQYTHQEKLSEEPIKIRVHFDKHATSYNHTFATARPVKLGVPFTCQLMPRGDRDFFRVTSPGSGTLKLRQIAKGKSHGQLYPTWMIDSKTSHRNGMWDRAVEAGETVTFFVQSSKYSYQTRSSSEQIELLLTYTPEDASAEPNNSVLEANSITLDTPFEFKLNPKSDRDYFKLTAPRSGIIRLTRLDKTKAHPSLQNWWGETEDRYMISERVMEKRVRQNETAIMAFQSSRHSWNDIGSDANIQFKAELIEEIDLHEPNDVGAEATPVRIAELFRYYMIPSNDEDVFVVKASSDGILVILGKDKKPLPHPAIWLEIGTEQWTKQPWITCQSNKRYLVKILGNQKGYGSNQPTDAIILSGNAKDFNLIPPTPRKLWSFDIKTTE